MKNVQRYDSFGIAGMHPFSLGNWVRLEDYTTLLRAYEQLAHTPTPEPVVRVDLGWDEIDPGTDPVPRNNDHQQDGA